MKLSKISPLLSGWGAMTSAWELQKPLVGYQPVSASTSEPSYREKLVSLHQKLVETPSVTYNESAVAHILSDYLEQQGFRTELQPVPQEAPEATKPRYNVLAWPLSASSSSPDISTSLSKKVLVSSHIDTVPPFIPYSRSDDDPTDETMIAGRGSADAKASVASQIIAVLELLASDTVKPEDLMLAYVVGEEHRGDGMRHLSDTMAAGEVEDTTELKAAIFGEPTEGKLACGHKGFFGCDITAHGRAGHSGYPWLGKSATEVLMRGMIKVLDTDLGSDDLFGNTTINVGKMEGGVAANVIPEKAVATIAGRVAIGPELGGADIVIERLTEVLRSVDEEAFEVTCRPGYGVVACECDIGDFEQITVNYGTDVANLKGNHTRILYGPGTIHVAHGPDEAIKLKDLEKAVEDYKKLIVYAVEN